MFDAFRLARDGSEELASNAKVMLESTSRNIFWGFFFIYLIGLFITAAWPQLLSINFWMALPLGILSCLVAIRLVSGHFRLAMILFQAGLATTILLLTWRFQWMELTFLLTLLPLISIVTLGLVAGIGTEALLIVLLVVLDRVLHWPINTLQFLLTAVGGGITCIIGWASIQSLLTVTEWSVFNYQNAQEKMEESRQHRAELAKLAKNLDLAYHQLERSNQMLVLARSEAEQAKDARNLFTLAISHELRAPLNFVVGFSEVMAKYPETYADLKDWPEGLYDDAKEIYHSSTHLLRLINDVLDLGQIEKMQMTLFKEWVSPAKLVDEVKEMVHSAFVGKNISLQLQVEPRLPDIFVDHTRIRQVLLNLVTNSLRFTERGYVKISAWREEKGVLFCVEDTGSGIAKEDIPKMFEMFHQVGNDNWRRREGSGLGITISKDFVELHGGKLWVESELGKGSKFYFSIPFRSSIDETLPINQQIEKSNEQYWQTLDAEAKKGRRVLAVSDDPSAAEVISSFVDPVKVVATGRIADLPQAVAKILPIAILVDQDMLNEDDLFEQAARLPYHVPILSFPFPGSASRPRDLPDCVVDYLVKPVPTEKLFRTFRSLGEQGGVLLVVDDDPAMIRYIERSIQSMSQNENSPENFQLITASTGQEAVEYIHSRRPTLIFLDLVLPDISGWEVLKEAQSAQIQVVIITAQDSPQELPSELQDSLRVRMHRPFKRHELNRILTAFLEVVSPDYPTALAPETHPEAAAH
jgi:signal transduction histidine kinase/response regulator of citrate/malate metabolism